MKELKSAWNTTSLQSSYYTKLCGLDQFVLSIHSPSADSAKQIFLSHDITSLTPREIQPYIPLTSFTHQKNSLNCSRIPAYQHKSKSTPSGLTYKLQLLVCLFFSSFESKAHRYNYWRFSHPLKEFLAHLYSNQLAYTFDVSTTSQVCWRRRSSVY